MSYKAETQLSEDFFDQMTLDIGQAEVAAAEAEGEVFMVEAEQVEDRRVEIVDGLLVLNNVVAVLISLTIDQAFLETAAG